MSLNMQVDGSFSCCCCVHIRRGSIHYLGWWAARRSSPRASLSDFDFDVHAHWWNLLSRPPAKHAGRIQSDALKITRLSASSYEICSIRGRVLLAELRQSIVNRTCTVGGVKTKLHSLAAFWTWETLFWWCWPIFFFYYLALFSASALVPLWSAEPVIRQVRDVFKWGGYSIDFFLFFLAAVKWKVNGFHVPYNLDAYRNTSIIVLVEGRKQKNKTKNKKQKNSKI